MSRKMMMIMKMTRKSMMIFTFHYSCHEQGCHCAPAVSARSSGLPTTGIDSSYDSTMAATTMDTTTADTGE